MQLTLLTRQKTITYRQFFTRQVHRFKKLQPGEKTCQNIRNDHLFGIKTAPAWPPLPSNSTFKLAGAAIAVTIPIDRPESAFKVD
jgi:hypothetical protein